MENYRKATVPAKLKKFYSEMNNALRLWYANSGNYPGSYEVDENTVRNGLETKVFYDNSFGKYLVNAKESTVENSMYICTAFNDGSGFCGYFYDKKQMHMFYCTEYKYCKTESYDGRNTFLFTLYLDTGEVVTASRGYKNYSREKLLSLCKYGNSNSEGTATTNHRHACTRLIQVDGWQIKQDYPWKALSLQ